MQTEFRTRRATLTDVEPILHIYNQGIEGRIATLEEDQLQINLQVIGRTG